MSALSICLSILIDKKIEYCIFFFFKIAVINLGFAVELI